MRHALHKRMFVHVSAGQFPINATFEEVGAARCLLHVVENSDSLKTRRYSSLPMRCLLGGDVSKLSIALETTVSRCSDAS
jgi:hypothetical protein